MYINIESNSNSSIQDLRNRIDNYSIRQEQVQAKLDSTYNTASETNKQEADVSVEQQRTQLETELNALEEQKVAAQKELDEQLQQLQARKEELKPTKSATEGDVKSQEPQFGL